MRNHRLELDQERPIFPGDGKLLEVGGVICFQALADFFKHRFDVAVKSCTVQLLSFLKVLEQFLLRWLSHTDSRTIQVIHHSTRFFKGHGNLPSDMLDTSLVRLENQTVMARCFGIPATHCLLKTCVLGISRHYNFRIAASRILISDHAPQHREFPNTQRTRPLTPIASVTIPEAELLRTPNNP